MGKPDFKVMSDQKCHCGGGIKKAVADRKEQPFLECFKCFRIKMASRGHDMSTAREVRQGKKPARKYRETIAERIQREKQEGQKR